MDIPIFLLDTNILIHDPKSIFSFPHGMVMLHFATLNELDGLKKDRSERGYNAREIIRLLEELGQNASLPEGVLLGNGGYLCISLPIDYVHPYLTDSVDDKIISLGLYLKEQGRDVRLLSKDFTVRVKASSLGITTEDYHEQGISCDNFYQGWKEFFFPSGDIKFKSDDLLKKLCEDYDFTVNEFALLRSHHADNYYKIFRYLGNGKFKELLDDNKVLWGIKGKNPHQDMVIDLLLDDTVKLVILCGPSGTGKTFLVLASLLYKVLCEQIYQKLIVSRPLVPLGPDIGYLPGDLNEKLQTWMQPIKDNLEYLIYMINDALPFDDDICHATVQHGNNKKKKKHGKNNYNNNGKFSKASLSVEDLLSSQHGKIALEAITYMRGRSIPNQAIFIDEVQNLTPHEVKTLISRAGEGSKVIMVGDPYQIDSPYLDFASNGLIVAAERFKGQEVFGSVYLHISERSILSSLANELM
jgi:PhoH-like ATPase